ncbi:BZ3500_MvSof-1268-A1-R1_Chr10-1g02667 [Microbotryum saponariae]|uniref:BZ3500_MvSof-1268-A1-R1_Chr10-1g02667 protein n=1 Tax=Microbotryum saponariae TaxID=289078 RepID=A0A2X0L749_9BASI|nr:BZ3500_MvSof-1268-A1-R1_Chr10-1g02667 [Microbotryum saponariae]SDA06156.1 BZ3501_MvSof-1269-A2-R1_Chr10-1g02268 [Microbotryum saponariae]
MVFHFQRRRSKSAGAVDSSPSPSRPAEPIPPVPALPSAMLTTNKERSKTNKLVRGMVRRVKSGGLHRKESSSTRGQPQLDKSVDPARGATPNRRSKISTSVPIPSIPPIRLDLSLTSSSLHSLGPPTSPHLDDEFASWLELVQAAGDSASDSTCETSCPSTPSYTNTSTSSCSAASSVSHASYKGTTTVKLASPPLTRSRAVLPSDPRFPIRPELAQYSRGSSLDPNTSNKNRVTEVDAEDAAIYGLDVAPPFPVTTYSRRQSTTPTPESTIHSNSYPINPKDRLGLGPRGVDVLDYTVLRLSSSFPRSVPIPSRLTRTLHHPLSTNKHRHIREKGPEMDMRVVLGRVGIARKAQRGATAHERIEVEGYGSVAGNEDDVVPLTGARSIAISLQQVLGPLVDTLPRSTIEEVPLTTAKTRSMRSTSLPATPQRIQQWATRPSFMDSHVEMLLYSDNIVLNRPIESRLRSPPLFMSGRIQTLAKIGGPPASSRGFTESITPFSKMYYRPQYRLPGPIGIGGVQTGLKERPSSYMSAHPASIGPSPRNSTRREKEQKEDDTPLALLVTRSMFTAPPMLVPRSIEPPQRPPRRRPVTQFVPKTPLAEDPSSPRPCLPEWKRREEIEQSLAKLNGSPPRRASGVRGSPRLSAQRAPIGNTHNISSFHPGKGLVHSTNTQPNLRPLSIGPLRSPDPGLSALGPTFHPLPHQARQPTYLHPSSSLPPTPNQTPLFLPIKTTHLSHDLSSPNLPPLARSPSSPPVNANSAVEPTTRPSRPIRAPTRPVLNSVSTSGSPLRDGKRKSYEIGSRMVQGNVVLSPRLTAARRVSEMRW